MVGDGNHSLATAKAHWDNLKQTLSEEERKNHPARFALCEVVNVYDEGIQFEPIHRIVKGVDKNEFVKNLSFSGNDVGAIYVDGVKTQINVSEDIAKAVSECDDYISDYISKHGGKVDYIHGEDAILQMTVNNSDYVGIILPKMNKGDLFTQVVKYGNLPRKTFSMGESAEKRYYIEAKEIIK